MSTLRTLVLPFALGALLACGGDPAPAPAPAPPPTPAAPAAAPTPPAPAAFSVVLDAAASSLEWKSIKNGDAPVNGKFTKVTGGLALTAADLGAATGALTIDLSGVDSGLELRDQRIAETFFGALPDAAAKATVRLTKLSPEAATLEPGGSTAATAELTVALAQGTAKIPAKVLVTRADENTWTVATAEDAAVSIQALGLGDPLAALITLCAHESVGDGVGIAASLTFRAAE